MVLFDNTCIIQTLHNNYVSYNLNTKSFYLSEIVDSSSIYSVYSFNTTYKYCNKLSYIKHKIDDIYISDNPSNIPIPLLICYDHCSITNLIDPEYMKKKWTYENRIIHNIAGESLCYREIESNELDFFFVYRKYDQIEDDTPYIRYISLI
jgi:hypothetical protein